MNNKTNKFTLKSQNYSYFKYLGNGVHLLKNEDGKLEKWFSNKNHGSFGLIYKNTHLEFVSSKI